MEACPAPGCGSDTSRGRARGRRRRHRSSSSARAIPSTATTRRTSRCGSRGQRKRPPREIAAEIAAEALERGLVERAEAAGPASSTSGSRTRGSPTALRGDPRGGRRVRRRLGRVSRERIQVEMVSANPTGPLTVAHARNGAYGDSVARLLAFAGHDGRARVLLQRRRARRWSASARRSRRVRRGEEPPEDGYHGEYIAELAARRATPCRAMLERIEATLERFRDPLRHLGAAERRSRREIPDALAAARHVRGGGRACGRGRPRTATTRTGVLVRSDGDADVLRRGRRLHPTTSSPRGFDRAIYVLGADHHGYVARLQALARDARLRPASAVEVLLYQLVHLVEGGEAKKMSKRRGDVVFLDELLDDDRRGRRALVPRLARPRPDDRDRRRPRGASERRRTPSTTSSTRTRAIAGILRNAARRCEPPPSSRLRRSRREERELVKRLLEFPARRAEAAERRAPHAIPTYAIRVADDFHRFYHRPPRPRARSGGVPARALPARPSAWSLAASI